MVYGEHTGIEEISSLVPLSHTCPCEQGRNLCLQDRLQVVSFQAGDNLANVWLLHMMLDTLLLGRQGTRRALAVDPLNWKPSCRKSLCDLTLLSGAGSSSQGSVNQEGGGHLNSAKRMVIEL